LLIVFWPKIINYAELKPISVGKEFIATASMISIFHIDFGGQRW